ncbi:MAG: phosphoglucomutase/phosphomannomutase alpha/beta/subunit [Fusobacteria bacterium]|nr:MAG: phosphoglucomutase/phosphomannomutase alpha/beta/subunit [Fusobacteriota bacterium]KAF0230143.1 MAG: phosphoglucomutase/phosphomannomutase [Fusobacteriota bacterium]
MDNWLKKHQQWINDEGITAQDKVLLKAMTPEEIKNNFYQDLEFGTAGIRGIRGLGTGRINKYLIRAVTQGYCDYLIEKISGAKEMGVAIAYDTRHMSEDFAFEAAKVFSGNGIKVHMYDRIRSTPELSFAIRELKTAGGLVLTASHNPPEYNGYKVYNQHGCQLSTEETSAMTNKINAITSFADLKLDDKIENIVYINNELEDIYIDKVKKLSINEFNKDLKIVYTPLYGVALKPIKRIFDEVGANCYLVDEQCQPNGDFPTAKKPNPEEKEALKMIIEEGYKVGGEILLATDPDGDRLGVMVLNNEDYIYLTGNQIGALLIDYILSNKSIINEKSYIITSIVTSDLGEKIAGFYGVGAVRTFTGFKNLGKKMDEIFADNGKVYFVYEESIGYLAEDFIRDKDGISAAFLIAELAGVLKKDGKNLLDKLNELYDKHGYYQEKQISYVIPGIKGIETIKGIMKDLRDNGPGEFGAELDLDTLNDYLTKTIDEENTDLLYYKFTDGSWVGVRPSGTEPKLKLYINVVGKSLIGATGKIENIESWFKKRVESWL